MVSSGLRAPFAAAPQGAVVARARRLATIDCETDPFQLGRVPVPFVWGYYCRKHGFLHWWGDDCTERFVEFLKQERVVAFAHNGGRFDFHYLTKYFEKGSAPLLINGRIARMPFGRAQLRDSWCVAPVRLAEIGKGEIDYGKLEVGRRDSHRPEITDYLQQDCVELYDYLARFESEHGRSLTIAGAAMREWTLLRGTTPKTGERYYNRLAPWYAGGRVQAFERGDIRGDFQLVDINSAYPRAMLEKHPYGGGFGVVRRNACLVPFDSDNRRFYRLRASHSGCLWSRSSTGGLSFEAGEGEYWATDWEVQAGLDTDSLDVHEVLERLDFEHCEDFSVYVGKWFRKKREATEAGDVAGRQIAKLFLNSLYGKWGANPAKYREIRLDDIGLVEIPDRRGTWLEGAELGDVGVYWRPLPKGKRRYYDVATAASITGYVRAAMWRAIAGSERVLYCDTDSLIGSGLQVDLGPEVGQWDVEVPRMDRVCIGGKKLYAAFSEGECVKQANKGVRLRPEQIVKVALGEAVLHESEVPTYTFGREPRFTSRTVRAT